jgi:hypothetical protein
MRQCAQQHQTALHPAHVACALVRRLAQLQAMGVDQLAQHQRLLDRHELA